MIFAELRAQYDGPVVQTQDLPAIKHVHVLGGRLGQPRLEAGRA
jgi:hypothetical protein